MRVALCTISNFVPAVRSPPDFSRLPADFSRLVPSFGGLYSDSLVFWEVQRVVSRPNVPPRLAPATCLRPGSGLLMVASRIW